MMGDIIVLILGLFLVIIGANGLVDGAASLAKSLNDSNMVIGLTIVAFGTSAPELTVSVYSAYAGNAEIAIGNVVGSNIANVFLILGFSAIIFPISVTKNTIWKEIPFSLLAAIVLFVAANDIFIDNGLENQISRSEGIVFIGFFIIFLIYAFEIARKPNSNPKDNAVESTLRSYPVWLSLLFVVAGLGALIFGGRYIVDAATSIARNLGMSESLIGLTIVAVGTSLPELATSIVAAFKRNTDIAVGNVVGSNIFNIFFILGTSASVKTLPIGNISIIDLALCVLSSMVLFVFVFTFKGRKINRIEGILLVLIYLGYLGYLIHQD